MSKTEAEAPAASNFIRAIIEGDLAAGRHTRVATRFPPEPNGYLHIGHAKSICLNFGLARDFGGVCNLRFDDTNPTTEDVEFVRSIEGDVRWLGFEPSAVLFASDYYEQLYQYAERLILDGLAYVDDQSEEEIRASRGSVSEPGRRSAGADRTVEENLDLFRQMRAGAFPDGSRVLRARIDMASANMKMRDPLLYRIRHAHHYRTGDDWCIYPMYDFAHCLSDAIEGITHSICTLEFDNNRELYDWIIAALPVPAVPHQYEFARLNLNYTVMSKRKLLTLVRDGDVTGWDDPRMPTIAGMRRRGVTPSALRAFAEVIGVSKANSVVDIALFDHVLRDDLNHEAPRVMAVLDPLEVTIETWADGETEWLDASYWPRDVPKEGSRKVPFTRTILIERDDFATDPPKGFFRLAPGREVRLRYGYVIRCERVITDDAGRVTGLVCSHDPATRGGNTPDGRKVKGTIHWVSATEGLPLEARVYDRLFSVPDPDARDGNFKQYMNPDGLVTYPNAMIEPSVAADDPETRYQLERLGYFWRDPVDGRGDRLVLNRIVGLKDSWAAKADAPVEQKADERAAKVAAPQAPRVVRAPEDPAGAARFARYTSDLGLQPSDALVLAEDAALAAFFEDALAASGNAGGVANWLFNELLGLVPGRSVDGLPFGGAALGGLVRLVDDGTVSTSGGKLVLSELVTSGGDPAAIVEARGLHQVDDPAALRPVVHDVIAAHPAEADAFRGGKTKLLGFFVGKVMQKTGGKANAALVNQLVREQLEG